MRVVLIELAHLLLVITAYNVRRERSLNGDKNEASFDLLERLTTQLENEFKEFYREEDSISDEPTPGKRAEHPSGDITVRIYPEGMKYLFEQTMLAIRHDAIRHRPHTMRTSYHGIDIFVDSIQVLDFVAPKLTAEHLGGSNFRFVTHGGGMRYLGLYSAVYKTTREGQFEARLDDIRVHLDVTFEKLGDHVAVATKKCSAKFEEVLVQMTPTMPSQILDLLRGRIEIRFQEKICPALIHFTKKLVNITPSIASIEDITPREVDVSSPCTVDHENAAWRYDTKGMKLSFKRANPRQKRSAADNSVKEAEVNQNEKASVSLTEDYINEVLADLMENDNVYFHLHRIPEVEKILETYCDEDQDCIGSVVNLERVKHGSGQLNSRITTTPFVELSDRDSAFLHLTLDTVLSFQNRAAHHRLPYLRLETFMKLRIADISIDQSEDDGSFKWSARFEIAELKVNKVHTDFEEVKKFASRLQDLLTQHRILVEVR
ncbi:hypothetical protein OESDEN_01272 [Oesophagostomum dentatum]|uniref:LBP / BPI / CETP family protein n=1 Tax=Oesophagostomum dentatum TaxID=61180 RepID=A0A0B1TNC3_OESDE|nr:hypothetical protein OESDEN_01272 [Oesophagostomum dentatum]